MINQKIKEIMENSQFSEIARSWKELLVKETAMEAIYIILNQKNNTKENSKFIQSYQKIIESIEDACFINDSEKSATEVKKAILQDLKSQDEHVDKKNQAKSFATEVKKAIIQGLNSQAEHLQIIAINVPMENYASIKRTIGLLKSHFNVSDDDLTSKSKMKI